jgi:uncharacterized membrane protein YbhN (UPF0104 family)
MAGEPQRKLRSGALAPVSEPGQVAQPTAPPPADMGTAGEQMPGELSPLRIRRRLLEFALIGAVIGVFVLIGPGLGSLRADISHASLGWLLAGVGLEVLSALCYVVIFRAAFCPRMSWRLSYLIGMSEQGANSVLSVSGAGGLALGAWALRRGGMSTEHIARRTVAFWFLTSLANVWTLILFAALFAAGAFPSDRNGITYAFGAAGLVATVLVIFGLPRLRRREAPIVVGPPGLRNRFAAATSFARNSLGDGVRDGLMLMRERPIAIFGGSFGVMGFDLAVLGVCFKAFGQAPGLGVLVVAYLIGQLGGNIPVPGGVGGLDAGLIGTFVLFHQPLAATTAAVLIYHAISLWIPGLLGSIAFVQLRRTLTSESQPASICMPLAEPMQTVRLPAAAGARRT